MKNEQYLTSNDLMQRYGVGDQTLAKWMKERSFPRPALMLGNRRRWSLSSVEAWDREIQARELAERSKS